MAACATPKTDGKRNNLYERIFITNSPVYEEVLPTIANPPSLRQKEGKQVVWTVTAPDTFQDDHERCRAIRAYGLDKIMQHSHEVTWRDDGDSFTMRLHAAPQKGGDAMLQWYIKAQNALGWLQGVYTQLHGFRDGQHELESRTGCSGSPTASGAAPGPAATR